MMLKHSITYKNFNEEEVTRDFYFNLSEAELVEMQVAQRGQMEAYLRNIINSGDSRKLLDTMLSFVKGAYGVRSDDGAEFIKTEIAWDRFRGSGAWDSLFLQMVKDPDFMVNFIRGILPANLREAADNNDPVKAKYEELKATGMSDAEARSRAEASRSHLPVQGPNQYSAPIVPSVQEHINGGTDTPMNPNGYSVG